MIVVCFDYPYIVSKKSYSLLNQMLLKYDGEYATFKQWSDLGGRIRKGEKAQMLPFPAGAAAFYIWVHRRVLQFKKTAWHAEYAYSKRSGSIILGAEFLVCSLKLLYFFVSTYLTIVHISPFKSIFNSLFNNDVVALTLPICPEVLSCHGSILKSPEKACKINNSTAQAGIYYTTATPFASWQNCLCLWQRWKTTCGKSWGSIPCVSPIPAWQRIPPHIPGREAWPPEIHPSCGFPWDGEDNHGIKGNAQMRGTTSASMGAVPFT